MVGEVGISRERVSGVAKRKIFHRTRKEFKLWRAMIAYVLKGHSTKKKDVMMMMMIISSLSKQKEFGDMTV